MYDYINIHYDRLIYIFIIHILEDNYVEREKERKSFEARINYVWRAGV